MVLGAIAKAIQHKAMFELEHRVFRVDGSLGWTHSRAVPRLSADGEVIEWFGAARDVSERKLAEEAIARLTAESERQRRLYEARVTDALEAKSAREQARATPLPPPVPRASIGPGGRS